MTNKRKKKKQKQTLNQIEFKKQIKRILQFTNRAIKKGYSFDEGFVPKEPKRITQKYLSKLKELTAKVLYSKMVWIDTETGVVISGTDKRQQERKESAQKALKTRQDNLVKAQQLTNELKKEREKKQQKQEQDEATLQLPNFSELVIDNFYNIVRTFPPRMQDVIFEWLTAIINAKGRDAVAEMLENAANAGHILTYTVSYDSDVEVLLGFLSDMLDYMPDLTPEQKIKIITEAEFSEDWENPE